MPFTIRPHIDLDQAIAILERHGIFGAVKKSDGTLRLYKRKSKRTDPNTGVEVSFIPEDQMTADKRKTLTQKGWVIVHSSYIPLSGRGVNAPRNSK